MPFNKAQEKSTEDKPIFSSQLYFSTVLMYLKNAQEYTLTISWPATNSKLLPSSRPNLSQKKKKKKKEDDYRKTSNGKLNMICKIVRL